MNIIIPKSAIRIAALVVCVFFSMSISAVEKYTIIWSVLGDASVFPPRIIEKGNLIGELPNPKIECEGKVFYGWTEVPNYNNSTEPPAIINERTTPQKSTTYYAVFAEKIQKEKATWDRTDIDRIESNDEVIISMKICLNDTYHYYALPNNPETSNPLALEVQVAEEQITNILLSETIKWNIVKSSGNTLTLHPSTIRDKWLYINEQKYLKIGTKTTDYNFIIQQNLLCSTTNEYFIGIDYKIQGQYMYWYWYAVSKNEFYTQQVCFFKKSQYVYLNFSTSRSEHTSLPLQIIEWKQDAIVVMYNGDPNQQAKIYINGNAKGENVTLSDCHKDFAIYEIPILGLASYTNQQLDIIIADQKKTCIIPLIISKETSTNDVANLSLNTDIVIQKGGILTLNSSEINAQTWGNVTIYGGGKIIVGPECTFNASSIIMRVGSVENNEYQAAYPQFILQGRLGTVLNFYIDYLTTYDRYYALSIPYAVNTTDIHYPIDIYGENVAPDNHGSFTLQFYDGASRADIGIGWNNLVEPATLVPYTGYTFWGAPKKVSVNGAEKERQNFGIHRLPVFDISIINENEVKNNVISVIAHGNEQTNDNDRGWNFLGNPYLGEYTGTIGDIRYITQTNDGKKYFSNEVANVTLDPFNTYFVQVDKNQSIPFNIPNSLYMQSPLKDKYNEISTGILLSCDEMVDRVGVLIADRYTENYDFNADLAKFYNHDLTVYANTKSGNLSYMAISPKTTNQSIEIGYKVLEGNQFTFRFDDSRYEAQAIDRLYLIDKELNVTTDLLQTDYSFYSDAGTYDQRFALKIELKNTTTNLVFLEESNVNVSIDSNIFNISNLPNKSELTICDLMGNIVLHRKIENHDLSITLQQGYYLVYIRYNKVPLVFKIIIS